MVLDTSFVVDLLRERATGLNGPATRFLSLHRGDSVTLPLFCRCELELGAERSSNPGRERRALTAIIDLVNPIGPEPGFETVYARAAAALLAAGTPIPVMDLLIGVVALQHAEPVVTRDVEHFRRIPGLVVHGYREV